ncbi:MAG: pectate lyase [Lentisphaeria bacterium]|nr:pectate lyase [Lentisphaeria bacterium]
MFKIAIAITVAFGLGVAIFESAAAEPAGMLAFPGAEGFGAGTRGGRGGVVFAVTTLDDYMPGKEQPIPGSLRAACDAEGPRTVVFRVSGTISLKKSLNITKPFLTIAGQTAPGDGICLKDYTLSIGTDEVIVRHLRVRLGHAAGKALDSISVWRGKNIILDHCSASWSVDETLSVTRGGKGTLRNTDNVTVQWCMITESLDKSVHKSRHSCGSLVRGSYGARYSFHHNIYAHHSGRSPRPGNYIGQDKDPEGLLFDFRNNVVYNWGSYAGRNLDPHSVTVANFVGNYYVTGPNSAKPIAFRQYCTFGKSYFHDNWMNAQCPEDPWSLVAFLEFGSGLRKTDYFKNAPEWTEELKAAFKQSAPIEMARVTTTDARTAYRQVLAGAGASLPVRDAVDKRIIEEIKTGAGRIIDDETSVGGWPVLRSAPAPTDTDNDGMPDAWESAHALDPATPSNNADPDKDGYTNLEEYLNGTDPGKAEPK